MALPTSHDELPLELAAVWPSRGPRILPGVRWRGAEDGEPGVLRAAPEDGLQRVGRGKIGRRSRAHHEEALRQGQPYARLLRAATEIRGVTERRALRRERGDEG